ncbi:beta-N-acetylhexosaminidase [Actinospica durhamensis]|uniref:beta-N-acetylhexosaminidase n=1 Tax=Actinospica durhamensis TaxID=1508375 RepID=A0A941F0P8_9ACTN|nr:beta-N-acetylhexosaminidase [Actinospica durhamensis]MBR7838324.1 beta-N-acetylhexosaminidase [Actinospica durhamensis]
MTLALIPQPRTVRELPGAFRLTQDTAIAAPGVSGEALRVAEYLADSLRRPTGLPLPVGETGAVLLALDPAVAVADDAAGDEEAGAHEAYVLSVTAEAVTLRAGTAEGLFRGVQTLRQLLPAAVERSTPDAQGDWTVPCVEIADRPRFGYRSAMLDVTRHFFPVADVKRLIDALAAYKFNALHLHLSDDQGWRVEIPSRPELTARASGFQVGEGPGGFYTVADYTELTAYAADRFVTVVPEVDVPGHTNAALLAYPELALDGFEATEYRGIEVGFSTLDPDNEETYAFLQDVFGDLAAMTPGRYLHLGGDEVDVLDKEQFERFLRRAAAIAAGTGKTVIGWEEIVMTGADEIVAQYWGRNHGHDTVEHGVSDEQFRDAVAKGTRAIVSPAAHSYLDMQYAPDSPFGLHWSGYVGVEQAYAWDPIEYLGGIEPERVLGIEAALWTETVATMAEAEYLIFPRLPGHAEVAWSPAGRDWAAYRTRLAAHAERWEAQGRSYFRAPEVWG